jgi:hypothetical protein
MKPKTSARHRLVPGKRGFALVISLTLMVLLTILAVGLLGLSAVSLRSSGAGEARAEAEANARMALMLAIGELQTTMGPDQSISARASVISANVAEPNLLGAWESWRWDPASSGPNYGEKEARFRRWLVSTLDPESALDVAAAGTPLADPIWLVNPQTVGMPDGANQAGPGLRGGRVPLEASETRRGAFAWGIMDESQKAPIQLEDKETTSDGERLARRTAPGRARPETMLASLSPESLGDPAKIVSLHTTVVAAGGESGRRILSYQGDVTPHSVGLLTDVSQGGFKTDLTTLFESTSASPNANGLATVYNSPQFTANDGAPRWEYLRSHYQLNRRVTSTVSGQPVMALSPTDLRPGNSGVTASPATERLLPVIAKLQIMFSAVTHHNHIGDRINFFNNHGVPKGNQNYGCPHLAYDPVITLYNPYDVALDLQKLRIRIWDPPVVFGFKKNNAWLRDEFASGNFHGLARFQIANERNSNARRYFTLFLREMNGSVPGRKIRLEPGEVKVFSPWVEPNWTWGLETAGGYNVRSFFDWNAGLDFGNRDGRTGQTMGIETVPGWDPRAGLQTDHLSYSSRPQSTRYDFEIAHNWNGGWLAIKNTDTFTVEAKPGRTVADAALPDFRVDLLAGSIADTTRDILRTYNFRFGNPTAEISATPAKPVISRTFLVGELLQKPTDTRPEGKSPFAILSMAAKTTVDPFDQSMPWLHNHPVVEGSDQVTARVGNALDSYDMRFEEVQDFNTFPGVEIEPGTYRGYYGASSTANRGVSNVPMFRVPLLPAASLGELIPANLVAGASLPRVTHAFGNSRAHPLIPSGSVQRSTPGGGSGKMLDHSYLLNDSLWDSTYFSTVANFTNPLVSGPDRKTLLTEFFKGERKLLNPRFIPNLQGQGSAEEQAAMLDGLDESTLSRRMGSALMVTGPFNVNSDSVDAWKAMLSSLRDAAVVGWRKSDQSPSGKTGFPRAGMPIAGDADDEGRRAGLDVAGKIRWAGFRALDDDQITTLAERIVEQIRARGVEDGAPSLTLGEFVNRRIGGSSELHVLSGLLQQAIEESGINDRFNAPGFDSKQLGTASLTHSAALNGLANPDARKGFSGEGAPSMLTQGDLLMALAPVITVRGDTFRIRAYGESRTKSGEVSAKAWCEAVVQRAPEYLDPRDQPELRAVELTQEANRRFGRRFVITSFRWLSPEEV